MGSPIKAIEYLEKCQLNIKGKEAAQVSQALQIAYEEGAGTTYQQALNPETYEKFMAEMKTRFEKPGIIKTGEAWELCRRSFGYGTVCNMMRHALYRMERNGIATKLKRGVWIIYDKPEKL